MPWAPGISHASLAQRQRRGHARHTALVSASFQAAIESLPEDDEAEFSARARGARIALIDGVPGAVWSVGAQPRVVFEFSVADGKVVAIDLLADPEELGSLDLGIG